MILLAKELECTTGWLLAGEGPEPGPPRAHGIEGDQGDKTVPIYNKVRDAGKIAESVAGYDLNGSMESHTDPQDWSILGKAHAVLTSGSPYSQALAANINTFHHALTTEKKVQEQNNKIDKLEAKCEEFIKEFAEIRKEIKAKNSDPSDTSADIKSDTAT